MTLTSPDPCVGYVDLDGNQHFQIFRGIKASGLESMMELYAIYGFTDITWSMGTDHNHSIKK